MIVASANYSFLAVVDISFRTLLPVFLSTPILVGGLGLDPPLIGTIMSFTGILNGIFTVFLFPRMTDWFGVKWVYLIGAIAAVPCFSLFPIMNYLGRNYIESGGGVGLWVWVAVGLQVFLSVLNGLCYGMSLWLSSNYHWRCFRRCGIHLHRRGRTQQGLSGDHEWVRSIVCGHRACGWARPGELGILAVD